jgi:PAS domain S-box-containing protein
MNPKPQDQFDYKNLRQRLLNALLAGVGVITVVVLVVILILRPPWGALDQDDTLLYLSLGMMLLGLVIIYALNRWLSVDVSAAAFLLLLTLIAAVSDTPRQVSEGRGLVMFTIPILAASLLLRPWAGFLFAVLSSLVIALVGMAVPQEIPNIPAMAIFFTLALISWLYSRSLKQARDSLQSSNIKLSESEERFRALIENSSDAVALLDPDGTIRYESPSISHVLGYSAEELFGKSVLALVHPKDLPGVVKGFTKLLKKPGRSASLQVRYRHKNGSWHWIEGVGTNLLANPAVRAFVVNYRDITERRQAEAALRESGEKYQNLFDLESDALFVIDNKSGQILEVNQAAAAMYGYSREELLKMKNTDLSVEPENTKKATKSTEIARGKQVIIPLRWHRRKDGTVFPTEITGRSFVWQGRSVHIAAIRDITERNRSEAEIHRLNAELEQRVAQRTVQLEATNKELEAFTYSVSHDLRAPLRVIDGFSKILLEKYAAGLEPEALRYLNLVTDNTRQMSRLIEDLLQLSRTVKQSMNVQTVAPADLVSQALADIEAEKVGRQVEIDIGSLPQCQADPALLKQVYLNLLSNALKFTRTREVARIQVGAQQEDGQSVYFVRDNGVGFDMKFVDKLFAVFQRLHSVDDYEGSGVGLAIVQRIIQRHGGRVWAEAEVDGGATFYFTLEGDRIND